MLLLGLGVGLARYVALFYSQRYDYMRVACIAVISFTMACFIVINLFPVFFSGIFFGNSNYSNLQFPLSVFLVGTIFHSLVYAYFRGVLAIVTFNLLEIINLAVMPLFFLFTLKDANLAEYVLRVGLAMIFVSLIFSVGFMRKLGKKNNKQFVVQGREMMRYGISRFFGDFMLNGFFSFTVIATVHFVTMKEVGYLSAGQSILNILAAGTAPLSLVLLPKIGTLIRERREMEMKESIDILLGALFFISMFISFQLMTFADKFLYYWLGSDFIEAVGIVHIIAASAGFYFIFLVLRSVLDAAEFKPINAINIAVSFAGFFAICAVLSFFFVDIKLLYVLTYGFSFGVVLLGVLTYFSVQKIYRRGFANDISLILTAIIINIFLAVLAMQLKNLINSFYSLILLEVIMGAFYLGIIWLLRIEWMRKLPSQIFSSAH
ncbi:MAG: hypothetical protein WCX69_00655 [Candidatus Paceibacterota bacterium]